MPVTRTNLAPTKAQVGLSNVDNTSDASKPVSTATQTALDARLFALPMPATGQYFYINSPHATGTAQTGTGTCRVSPWIVGKALTIVRIGAEVSTVGEAGSKFRIVIYNDNGNGLPGTLLLDAGQIAGDSASVQELTISQALTPGVYWVGGATQTVVTTQPTMRIAGTWTPPTTIPLGASIPSSNSQAYGVAMTGMTGAAPASFTSAGGSSVVPRIFAKVA